VVRIQGIEKPGYSFTVAGGLYRLFNITDPYPTGMQGRLYNIEATPSPLDFSLYESRVKDVFIEQEPATPGLPPDYPPVGRTDFVIGFRSTQCTDACTLESDPIPGTCRIDCAGYAGCPNSTESGYQALEACQGLSSGFTTSASGNIYRCCTSDITTAGIAPLSAAFEVNATNVARSERLVMLGGKLVKLVVITFD